MATKTLIQAKTAAEAGVVFPSGAFGSVIFMAQGLAGAEVVDIKLGGHTSAVAYAEAGVEVKLTASQPTAILPAGPQYIIDKSATAAAVEVLVVETTASLSEPAGSGYSVAMLLMIGGQSNGAARAPNVTTSYDDRLFRFVGGMETTDRLDGSSATNAFPTGWFDSLVAFDESSKDRESLSPGIAAATPSSISEIITMAPAIGARHFRELMPGSGSWSNMHNALRIGKEFAISRGASAVQNVLVVDHGEADSDNIAPGGSATDGTITASDYQSILEQWTQYAKQNVKLVQADPTADIIVLGTQPCIVNGDGWRNMQNGHISAAIGASGYLLSGPRYAFLYDSDGVHIIGAGKRLYAEYLGHRLQDVQAGRELPVYITGGSRSGAVITLDYNTIVGDLVIDTTAVPETTTSYPNSLYGFECFKVSDSSVLSISSINVSGTTLTLTLSADPGEAVRVRYAQQTWPGGNQSVTGSSSKLNRGNIRDSGSHVAAYDGSSLYNWACHQSIEVA